jgi:hypothetical protein
MTPSRYEAGVVSGPVQVPGDDQRRPDADDFGAEAGSDGLTGLGNLSRAADLESTSGQAARHDGVRRLIVDNQRHSGIAPDISQLLRLVQERTADFDGAVGIDPERDRVNLRRAVGAYARQSPKGMGAEVSVLDLGEHKRRVEPQQ